MTKGPGTAHAMGLGKEASSLDSKTLFCFLLESPAIAAVMSLGGTSSPQPCPPFRVSALFLAAADRTQMPAPASVLAPAARRAVDGYG